MWDGISYAQRAADKVLELQIQNQGSEDRLSHLNKYVCSRRGVSQLSEEQERLGDLFSRGRWRFSFAHGVPVIENASQQTQDVQHLSTAGMDTGTWLL